MTLKPIFSYRVKRTPIRTHYLGPCEVCGKTMHATRRTRRYCSDRCRTTAHRAAKPQLEAARQERRRERRRKP